MRIRTIRGKILFSVLGTVSLGIILIIIISAGLVVNFSSQSAEVTFKTMKDEELRNLNLVASDKSLIVEEYLKGVKTDIEMAWSYATDLFNGRINATPIESYWADSVIDSRTPPGKYVDDYYGFGKATWDHSTIFVPNVKTRAEYEALPAGTKNLINISSNLEYIFKAMHASNPNYIWIYMAFEERGLFRQLPYNDMSWAREDNYDSRLQKWYRKAVTSNGLNIFLDLDPESGLVLTSSMPVKFDNGSLVGVISVDLPLQAVQDAILAGSILKNGYSYLLDSSGNALVHPKLVTNPELFGKPIEQLEGVTGSSDFLGILTSAREGNTGQGSYTKSGKNWYASYTPAFEGRFVIFVVVPEADIIQPANEIKQRIYSELVIGLLYFLVGVILLSVGIVYGAKWVSDKIVEPVTELTEVCKQITQGDLSRDLRGGGGGSAEVNLLYNTFEGLVIALRFGNEEYYAGNINRAMDNYQKALQLFTTLDNQKGVGICLNNIGNIHRARGNLKDANASYRESITIAENLLDSADEAEKIDLTASLASRYNNLGMLYVDIEEYDKAEEYVRKALELDRQVDNAKGFATRYGNLGTIYLAKGDMKRAKEYFDEEREVAVSLQSDRLIAYSYYNMGIYYRTAGNYEEAVESFLKAVEIAEELDFRVTSSSLKNLSEIYRERGETELADEIDNRMNSVIASSRLKFVTFVLDVSGSMAGKRIRAAKNGILEIFKNQIFSDDLVRVIVFSNTAREYISTRPKRGNEKDIIIAISKMERPRGATAFYDALGEAMTNIKDMSRDNWIVALTDGDDNSSFRHNLSSLKKLAARAIGVNLVVIGVGRLTHKKELEEICNLTDNGRYIDVSSGVAEAISSAFEEISSMLMAVDVEGFVPDY